MTIKNKPDKETLYKLYVVDELSPPEIAKMYGYSYNTIVRWIKGYNIHFRGIKEAHNTKRILIKRHNNMLGDKNPTKRDDVKATMSENHWLKSGSDAAKDHINLYIIPRMLSEDNPMKNPDIAKQHGDAMRGDKNPAKRPEVGMKISATNMGRVGGFLGKTHTDEYCERLSARRQDQIYPDEWTGFIPPDRPHLINANQCIHLNPWFEGCNQHHIMTGVVINIPSDLHKSVYHRMTNGDREDKNMKEINKLAFKYLLGKL